jgi:hypothetical protein
MIMAKSRIVDKVADEGKDRRRQWREHWEEFERLNEQYEAADTDYRCRIYPKFPEHLRGLTCGAKSKRSGQPCKQLNIYLNGRCKFHGGASTGPRTAAGKRKAAKNGKKGGRPKVKPDSMEC